MCTATRHPSQCSAVTTKTRAAKLMEKLVGEIEKRLPANIEVFSFSISGPSILEACWGITRHCLGKIGNIGIDAIRMGNLEINGVALA